MSDPILVLAWLILAHLVADFVIQTDGIVAAKTSTGARAWRGVLAHGIGVAVCLVPVAVAFGVPGLWALVVIVVAHVVIDRAKVVATRRAEAGALAGAARRHEGLAPVQGLGRAWTPLPAAYFVADQIAHLAAIGLAWGVFLAGQSPTVEWSSAMSQVLAGRDTVAFHGVVLGAVVVVSLVIANVRGGALLVATLVRPIEAATGADASPGTSIAIRPPAQGAVTTSDAQVERIRGWSFRIGPLAGRVVADPPAPSDGIAAGDPPPRMSAPGQIGATIGVLERLLIVTLLLAGAEAAIGLVVAAKTIARFRLLDDRDFAEYYLLGTLASVSVAIVTALAARAALAA
jgi:Protein of unknown function (DUF3307)